MRTVAFLAVIALFLAGCTARTEVDVPVETPAKPRPLRVVLLYDVSGSTQFHNINELKEDDIRELLDVVSQQGGELAFGTIPMPQNVGLVTASFPSPPSPPANAVNLFRRMQEAGLYRTALSQWREEQAQIANKFLADIRPLIRRRDAKGTPLFRGLRMANLFLGEPGHEGVGYVILVSDGYDTTGDPPIKAMPQGVELLLVNGDGSLGTISHLRPIQFATIRNALMYIRRSLEGGSHR